MYSRESFWKASQQDLSNIFSRRHRVDHSIIAITVRVGKSQPIASRKAEIDTSSCPCQCTLPIMHRIGQVWANSALWCSCVAFCVQSLWSASATEPANYKFEKINTDSERAKNWKVAPSTNVTKFCPKKWLLRAVSASKRPSSTCLRRQCLR